MDNMLYNCCTFATTSSACLLCSGDGSSSSSLPAQWFKEYLWVPIDWSKNAWAKSWTVLAIDWANLAWRSKVFQADLNQGPSTGN
mmetsp:Transcript_6909/g.12234  ORF Transcript_6909/g.12234 Transcript_6909/m.12234 type:complete len:85 (+) Transcript_6909:238-492(+)